MRSGSLKTLGYVSTICLASVSCGPREEEGKKIPHNPNIVFILIDDLGYYDLGYTGSGFYETPNIDKLADQGAFFTNFYSASAVCSPTRASIMTGKHPARIGITDWVGPDEWHRKGPLKTPETLEFIDPDDTTLAEYLGARGYQSLYLGKWHLGKDEHYPDHHGFDRMTGVSSAGAPPSYFYPYTRQNWAGTGWPVSLEDLIPGGKEGEYLTDRLTDEALEFMEENAGKGPFFLFLAHYGVHKPFEAPDSLLEKYRRKAERMYGEEEDSLSAEKNGSYNRTRQSHPVYAAMIESIDQSTGRIMEKIRDLGIERNTILVFTSDNGGLSTYAFPLPGEEVDANAIATSNYPLRAGKGWYYEGGIRIPTIISWPGVIADSLTISTPLTTQDFYPTLARLTGNEFSSEIQLDGINFSCLLLNEKDHNDRDLVYWHYPHYHNSGQNPVSAIRNERYKLIYHYEDGKAELYDLILDEGETRDISEKKPEVRDELLKQLENWKQNLHLKIHSP